MEEREVALRRSFGDGNAVMERADGERDHVGTRERGKVK